MRVTVVCRSLLSLLMFDPWLAIWRLLCWHGRNLYSAGVQAHKLCAQLFIALDFVISTFYDEGQCCCNFVKRRAQNREKQSLLPSRDLTTSVNCNCHPPTSTHLKSALFYNFLIYFLILFVQKIIKNILYVIIDTFSFSLKMSLNVCFLQVLPQGVVLRDCDSDRDSWGVRRV